MLPVARAAPLALAVERYGLSAFFLYLAWGEIAQVRAHHAVLLTGDAPEGLFAEIVKHVLVVLLDLLVGMLLLSSRRPLVPPQEWKDVLVPLAANFFYLAYNLAEWVPAPLSANRWPAAWRMALAHVALYLGLSGFALAIWAILHLGRSFAVLVTVKRVVMRGPYRFVRHPIYLSYVLQTAGFVCAYGSLAFVALVAAHVALLVYRAHLEEARLAAHSDEYRDYRAKTGFLMPRWP